MCVYPPESPMRPHSHLMKLLKPHYKYNLIVTVEYKQPNESVLRYSYSIHDW